MINSPAFVSDSTKKPPLKVVIYIGHHKVGSTALQTYLAQNTLRLARHGILYPCVESQGFASFMARAMRGRDVSTPEPVNAREPHSALAYRLISDVSNRPIPQQFVTLPTSGQMGLSIRRQINRLKPNTVLICSEALANFGEVEPKLVKRLCQIFPRAKFQIYCALRRPDEYLTSWHGQRLKAGEKLPPLSADQVSKYRKTIHFDYRKMLEAWLEYCPKATFTIRNYAEIRDAGGSCDDFVAQSGVNFPKGMIPAGRVNKSLPLATVEIARLANHALTKPQASKLHHYLVTETAGLDLIRNSEIEMIGAKQRAELLRDFAPMQDYLSRITGQDAFFPDLNDIARTRPISEAKAMRHTLERLAATAPPQDRNARAFLAGLRQQHEFS
ncbi:MAG: hypothetical protein KUG70_06030 [Rhodobacteraceae bacterium]|nr:hypothetical protein [Paracoccaceae bacterium]